MVLCVSTPFCDMTLLWVPDSRGGIDAPHHLNLGWPVTCLTKRMPCAWHQGNSEAILVEVLRISLWFVESGSRWRNLSFSGGMKPVEGRLWGTRCSIRRQGPVKEKQGPTLHEPSHLSCLSWAPDRQEGCLWYLSPSPDTRRHRDWQPSLCPAQFPVPKNHELHSSIYLRHKVEGGCLNIY